MQCTKPQTMRSRRADLQHPHQFAPGNSLVRVNCASSELLLMPSRSCSLGEKTQQEYFHGCDGRFFILFPDVFLEKGRTGRSLRCFRQMALVFFTCCLLGCCLFGIRLLFVRGLGSHFVLLVFSSSSPPTIMVCLQSNHCQRQNKYHGKK